MVEITSLIFSFFRRLIHREDGCRANVEKLHDCAVIDVHFNVQ